METCEQHANTPSATPAFDDLRPALFEAPTPARTLHESHIYIYIYISMYACMYVSVSVCVCVCVCACVCVCIYIYIYIQPSIDKYISFREARRRSLGPYAVTCAVVLVVVVRSVFKISCLFLRPRPWQFEIRDSMDK